MPLLVQYNAVMDVHLMISNPDIYLKEFAEAGADIITVHVESCGRLGETVDMIRSLGVRPGITLNPDTELEKILEVIPNVDLVLIMSVYPGFGGQELLPATMAKIASVRKILDETESQAELEVDGGIKVSNAHLVVQAGASVIVAGSAIFSSGTRIAHNIAEIRKAVDM